MFFVIWLVDLFFCFKRLGKLYVDCREGFVLTESESNTFLSAGPYLLKIKLESLVFVVGNFSNICCFCRQHGLSFCPALVFNIKFQIMKGRGSEKSG